MNIAIKHPVPMKTLFRHCFLVNFSINPNVMASLLPRPLIPDVYQGRAFLSIVIADMVRMRPAFVPRVLGITYLQVVYRAMVLCNGERGVHFIRSDANNRLMCGMGNWLTYFQFNYSEMSLRFEDRLVHFDLRAKPNEQADIHAVFDLNHVSGEMPATSSFSTVADAQRFLVEQYAAYAPDARTKDVTRVRIRREPWNIAVVKDLQTDYQFMRAHAPFNSDNTRLDSIFYVANIPYYWHTLERIGKINGA